MAFLVVGVPILAIIAFVRVRELESRAAGGTHSGSLQDSVALQKLRELEQRILGIEKALGRLMEQGVAPSAVTPPTAPTPAATAEVIPSAAIRPAVAPEPIPSTPAAPPRAISPTTSTVEPPAVPPREPDKFPIASSPAPDFENVVAGKWLNYVGIVALLFATAFFIKYAFDNNWVGPRGRVAIGLLAGTALLVWSERLLRRGYKYFSEGIAGLGAAVLYLSIWGGMHYYHIFTSGQAFAGMIVVTAVMAAVSLGRNSQRLAMLALAGGFLTPTLVSTGQDHEIVLFTYTALLSAAMLAIERARSWKWLPPLAFAATEFYYWGWYNEFYTAEKLGRTLAFAVLFFVLFAALPIIRSRRKGRIGDTEYFIAIGNVFAILLALQQMLWPEYRWGLTASYLALAAVHLIAVRALPEPKPGAGDATLHVRWLFAGLAQLCVSLAIPARLDHQWLTIAWAIEGALLVWGGVRIESWKLRISGVVFFAITAVRLIFLEIPAHQFIWNERFLAYAIAVACFALSCRFVRGIADDLAAEERNVFGALAVGVNVYALIALSLEVWDFFWRTQALGLERWLAQQLGLSVLWTLYAAGLIAIGLARRSALLRWQALTLFGLVVAKVFLYDMSSLDRIYRIISFLVLGVLLLGVSFAYQRRAMVHKAEKKT
ncbi:MAG TPA: DUF2339 domain-containing protein [Candidatus Acidoferrales bacterium]|nr:DUF2339 domain-containing protein [Candidatus Acidoferrales bacterium]